MFLSHLILVRDKRGFTLLEMILVVAITGLALTTLLHFYGIGLMGSLRGSGKIDIQQNARIALHEITRELRYAADIYDKDSGQRIEMEMPLYTDGQTRGAARLFLRGTDGKERELRFNETKGNIILRQAGGPDNELGYSIKKLEFFWYIPKEMLMEENVATFKPNMILVLLVAQEVDKTGKPRTSPYTLRNIVHLKNVGW